MDWAISVIFSVFQNSFCKKKSFPESLVYFTCKNIWAGDFENRRSLSNILVSLMLSGVFKFSIASGANNGVLNFSRILHISSRFSCLTLLLIS